MDTRIAFSPCWSTASFGHSADASSLDLLALGEHLDLCRRSRGRLFAFQCAAERIDGFVAGRLVTTLFAALTLIGLVSLVY